MSFLFGKKKQSHHALPPATRETHTSGGSGTTSSIPTANGIKTKDRGPDGAQSPPPGPPPGSLPGPTAGGSVNNSLNSISEAHAPSPDHALDQHGGLEQDLPFAPRSAPNGASPLDRNPAALFPWSQRRLTFTSSQPNPFPRYGAAVNAVSSKEGDVYLMGGLVNGSTVKGDLWLIEAGGGSLNCYPVGTTFEGPGPRVGHASLLVGNAFIVFGGDTKMDDRDKLDDTLYLLNTSTRHWSRSMPPGPRPAGRYGHTLNILGSKIYVFGGQVEGYFFNDLIAFDLNALQSANSKWEQLIQNSNEGGPPEGQVPPARTNHTVVSWNDKLYLFGGTNGNQWFNDVWSYDPMLQAWTQLDCIGYIPAPREGHSAALVNDVMYIFGGRTEEGADLGDLAAFRITSRRWYTFQNMGPSPSPRSGHSMTAFGKQIVVLAGEPSSAPRDAGELSLVYVLDTSKIRYPNDQQIQQTPSGERAQGNRRPSGERGAASQIRGPSRGGSSGPFDGLGRKYSGSRGDLVPTEPNRPGGSGGRGQDMTMGNGPPGQGPGSRLPRASIAQSPPGPPPQQQAPPPRVNGSVPSLIGPRSRTPTKDNRGFGPPVDTLRATSADKGAVAPINPPIIIEGPRPGASSRALSPVVNGRQTPQQQPMQQPSNLVTGMRENDDPQRLNEDSIRSRSRQAAHEALADNNEFTRSNIQQQHPSPEFYNNPDSSSPVKDRAIRSEFSPTAQQLAEIKSQHEALSKEFEAAKSRNAWYASELSLARKAGYQQNSSHSPILDEKAASSFGEEDKPLIEALITMRARLAEVQESVDSRVVAAAQEVAEIEQQRDVAIREAVYAKAKLAAHGGSHAGTPLSESMSREASSDDRSTDIGRKLAAALATQHELRSTIDAMTTEIQAEKRARELAEGTAEAAQKRAEVLDQSRNPDEIENLRMELHEVRKGAREEAAQMSQARAKLQLLELDKGDLARQLEEALEEKRLHSTVFVSLREAVGVSDDKVSHLEKKLEEERTEREAVGQRLLQLRAEHEERTAELEATARKLRDAEEIANTHANEARTHRQVVLAGLDRVNAETGERAVAPADERVSALRQQVDDAHGLVRKIQEDADDATEKLRNAEKRIASLEAHHEQSSRDALTTRKELQDNVREFQAIQNKHDAVQRQLESEQREASALSAQHNALKDLLGERGVSESGRTRNFDSPESRLDNSSQARVNELEQQLSASLKEHEEAKSSFEAREQEADKVWNEKIDQLQQDYESAVHYVKGTEKMLKRMKDELTKYKAQNARLQRELEGSHHSRSRSIESDAAAEWEQERQSLHREIGVMQDSVKESVAQFERQREEVQAELFAAQEDRDHLRHLHEQAEQQLTHTSQRARAELEQLKSENSMLESRAIDAEQRVTLLLDQVNASVGNYRRQSQQIQPSGHLRTLSSTSTTSALPSTTSRGNHSQTNSISTDPSFAGSAPETVVPTNNRNSLALDSLASELESLRNHWEGTHRNYRLSNQFDFDRSPVTPGTAGGEVMSDSLASWRRRLEAETGRGQDDEGDDVATPVGTGEKRRIGGPVEGTWVTSGKSEAASGAAEAGSREQERSGGKRLVMPGGLDMDDEKMELQRGRKAAI